MSSFETNAQLFDVVGSKRLPSGSNPSVAAMLSKRGNKENHHAIRTRDTVSPKFFGT